ncbi:MAG TPA: magnesium transporter CorA family protein [Candidatus Limnocylindrales bacterium]|nr:magnesium transporter CorA family protein [Candidatus Limnocylindrales bacterium]
MDEPALRGYAIVADDLRELRSIDEVHAAHEAGASSIWVDVTSPDGPTLAGLAGCLQLHPLVEEDILERNQRAKVERIGGLLHLVAFELSYIEGQTLGASEIDLVLGEGFLLTTHEPDWDPFALETVSRDPRALLVPGPDHVLWALCDAIVDGYFPVFDRLGDAIEQLQDAVMARPSRAVVERLFRLRRDLLLARHAVSPQREIFNQLTNREEPLIDPERLLYFRDVYDHLIRLTDELDSYRELASTTLDVYLSTVNNNLSEIMKRLTAVTVILAGIGAVAGIFGMSEAGSALRLGEAPGFWLITLAMLLVAGLALVYFRRIDWL